MGLGRHYNTHPPSGILKGHQRAAAGYIPGEFFYHLKELIPLHGNGKAFPVRFLRLIKEGGRISQAGPFSGHFFPEFTRHGGFRTEPGRRIHIAQSRVVRHTAIGHDTEIAILQRDDFFFPVPVQMDCGRRDFFSVLKINVCYRRTDAEINPMAFQPFLNGENHGLILVIRRPRHTLQCFNS